MAAARVSFVKGKTRAKNKVHKPLFHCGANRRVFNRLPHFFVSNSSNGARARTKQSNGNKRWNTHVNRQTNTEVNTLNYKSILNVFELFVCLFVVFHAQESSSWMFKRNSCYKWYTQHSSIRYTQVVYTKSWYTQQVYIFPGYLGFVHYFNHSEIVMGLTGGV